MLRYLVERIADGEFLELELPIDVSGAGTALCGPGSFHGELTPDVGALRNPDGTLIIEPNSTYIHEESEGVIRGTWIVTRSELDGASWVVEGAGFSHVFRDRVFEGEYRGVNVDPVAAARHVVEHAQSFPDSRFGIALVGSSGVRVGTNSDELEAQAQSQAASAKAAYDAAKAALDAARAAAKVDPSPANKALVESRKAQADAASAAKKAADERLRGAKALVKEDEGAWKILWWDMPDCFDAITEAIDAAGMEWVEWSGWSEDRTRILKEIRVSDGVGRKRDDLLFVEGDNIIETVVVEDDSGEYANKVFGIGAGEGRDALRVIASASDGRMSKHAVLDAKHVTKKTVLEQLTQAELHRRMQHLRIPAIRVMDHNFAQFGTFGVGDTILVDADLSWVGRQRVWRRISEVETVGDGVMDLMLEDA